MTVHGVVRIFNGRRHSLFEELRSISRYRGTWLSVVPIILGAGGEPNVFVTGYAALVTVVLPGSGLDEIPLMSETLYKGGRRWRDVDFGDWDYHRTRSIFGGYWQCPIARYVHHDVIRRLTGSAVGQIRDEPVGLWYGFAIDLDREIELVLARIQV